MSDYQCYEFVAVDRRLTAKQQDALRARDHTVDARALLCPAASFGRLLVSVVVSELSTAGPGDVRRRRRLAVRRDDVIAVIALGTGLLRLGDKCRAIPVSALWQGFRDPEH